MAFTTFQNQRRPKKLESPIRKCRVRSSTVPKSRVHPSHKSHSSHSVTLVRRRNTKLVRVAHHNVSSHFICISCSTAMSARNQRGASLLAGSHPRARSLSLAPSPFRAGDRAAIPQLVECRRGPPSRLSRAPEASYGLDAFRQADAARLLHTLGARDTGTGIEWVSRYRGFIFDVSSLRSSVVEWVGTTTL